MHFLAVSLPSFMMCCAANFASLFDQELKLSIWQTTRVHVLCQPYGELEASSDRDLELTKHVLKLLFGETVNSSSRLRELEFADQGWFRELEFAD